MLVGLVIVIALLLKLPYLSQEITLNENPAQDQTLSSETLNGRFEIWSQAVYVIQDFPFTGMGINTFGHVMPVVYPLLTVGQSVNLNAHNTYLQVALDLGIPGLIGFLGVQLGTFWMWRKIWNSILSQKSPLISDPPFPLFNGSRLLAKTILLGMGGAMVAQIIFGLTEFKCPGNISASMGIDRFNHRSVHSVASQT